MRQASTNSGPIISKFIISDTDIQPIATMNELGELIFLRGRTDGVCLKFPLFYGRMGSDYPNVTSDTLGNRLNHSAVATVMTTDIDSEAFTIDVLVNVIEFLEHVLRVIKVPGGKL